MTKQKKLKELGYYIDTIEYHNNKPLAIIYIKYFKYCHIRVWLSLLNDKHFSLSVRYDSEEFAYQEVIDNLQQAFDVRNKDLEELKKCQD